jgi:hypothetical protein
MPNYYNLRDLLNIKDEEFVLIDKYFADHVEQFEQTMSL